VLDAVSSEKDDWIPTLLMPWRGAAPKRRSNNLSPRSTAMRGLSERQ
jgi:hypothetical protein